MPDTAVVGALALFGNEDPPATSPAQTGVEAPPVPAGAGGEGAAIDPACYSVYLAGIPEGRRKWIDTGSADRVLLGVTESKSDVVAVRLTHDEQPLRMLKLRVRTADETFHIEEVVDASCRPVTDIANASRGGEPRVLQNWDEARLGIAGTAYLLRLGYSGGEVTAGYLRRVVE